MRNAFAPRFAALPVVGSLIMMVITSSPVLGADPYFKDVCAAGCTYSSVQAAIDSITDSGSTKVYTVFLDSGVLTSDTSISTQGKSYINFVGRGMGLSVLRASALWFQNVGGGLTSSDFFDMSGSTNVSVTRLTVDARTADPGGYGPTTSYSAVKVDLAATGKILFDNCEIQGITNALYDVSIAQGGLVEVFNSKIRAAQYGIYAYGAHWHIFSSDIRAVDDGGTSGSVISPVALYNYGADTTVWGSHLHGESSQANKSYDVNAVRPILGTVTIFGSTVHVKMTTTSIGSPNRPMSSAFVFGGTGNFIGTEFLYENTGGALSQGRLAGLRVGFGANINLVGCTFRDGGGSGGTSRTDLLTGGSAQGTFQVAGTKVASFASMAGSVPPGIAKEFDTLGTQKGVFTFGQGTSFVTLPVPLPDTNYRVALSPGANETIWVTGKTTTGFTLNSSNPGSTAIVDWVIMR